VLADPNDEWNRNMDAFMLVVCSTAPFPFLITVPRANIDDFLVRVLLRRSRVDARADEHPESDHQTEQNAG